MFTAVFTASFFYFQLCFSCPMFWILTRSIGAQLHRSISDIFNCDTSSSSPSLNVIRHDRFVHVPSGKIRTWGTTNNSQSIQWIHVVLVLTCVALQTCGQRPPDLALLSISWMVFFLESGSFLSTNTGWRQRTNPAATTAAHRYEQTREETVSRNLTFWGPRHPIICLSPTVTPAAF